MPYDTEALTAASPDPAAHFPAAERVRRSTPAAASKLIEQEENLE